MLIFFDDILVYNRGEKEHHEHLRIVLQVPKDHSFYANEKKYAFAQSSVAYL